MHREGWFEAFGSNSYSNLVGNPNGFRFETLQPGAIINAGDLEVSEGQNLSLIGGEVLSTGSLTAPEGNISVMTVPGTSRVRLTQEGQLLSLEVELPTDNQGNLLAIEPLMLAELLTNGGVVEATGITAAEVEAEAGDIVVNQVTAYTATLGNVDAYIGGGSTGGRNSGSINISAEDKIKLGGGVDSTTILNANISTASQDITLGNVLLGDDITLDTDSGGGDVTFTGTVNNNQNLTINAGTGTTLFNGIVGGNTPLNILITDVGVTTRISQDITANKLEFNDPLDIALDLNLATNEIDLGATVSSSGSSLVLQALTPNQDFDLTATFTLLNGFESITIGTADGIGLITLNGDVSFDSPLLIQSPKGSGSIEINGAMIGQGDASIELTANQTITTSDITANGGIILTSQTETVTSGNLNS